MSDFSIDQIREQLPSYLSREAQDALASAFRRVPEDKEYYLLGRYQEEFLQGDCWGALQVIEFDTGLRRKVVGIILSNTCDLDSNNMRDLPPRVVFAPVVPLKAFIRCLVEAKISADRIESKLLAIRKQKITTIFYLPDAVGGLDGEHIVVLDDVHSMPISILQNSPQRRKRCTLNNFGFYMFIFKLSIHFCRLGEGLQRSVTPAT